MKFEIELVVIGLQKQLDPLLVEAFCNLFALSHT
jgi:hypothetical protein